jgi:O-antigen ligase
LEIFQYPHNLFLNIWVELGLLGVLSFLWLAFEVWRLMAKTAGKAMPPYRLCIFAALLQMTIHGLADVPYFKNDLALFTWSLLALLFIASATTAPLPIQPKTEKLEM